MKDEKEVKKTIEVEAVVPEQQELVVKSEASLSKSDKQAIGKLDEFDSMNDMLDFAKVLVDSKMVPFGSAEQVVTVVLQAKELGIGAVTGLYNIYFIENKPTLSIHCMGALLEKAGIAWTLIEDGVFVSKSGEVIKTKEEGCDVRTTIRFFKSWKGVMLTQDTSFTWKDAIKAGLHEKQNWAKYPKPMLYNRCFAIGARRISPASLLGLMETTEMADVSNISYKVDDEGNIIEK
jgi:hypothetical protein